MVCLKTMQACLLLLCSSTVLAKNSRLERVLQAGTNATVAQAPAAPAASSAALGQLRNFVLIVDLKFKSEEDVQRYGEIFTPETLYVRTNEAGRNYAYKLLQSEDSPLHLTIFERYESKSYWEDVHSQSQAFKDYAQRLKDAKLEMELSTSYFYETGIGYI